MDADWIKSPSAQRVLAMEGDARPVWLWSQDGRQLIWSNTAATRFLATLENGKLLLAPLATPLKGQVARLIRMGSIGRASPSHLQFMVGDKPASATCTCVPLLWDENQPVLLIVGRDPVAPEILAADAGPVPAGAPDEIAELIETDEANFRKDLQSWSEVDAPPEIAPVAPEPTPMIKPAGLPGQKRLSDLMDRLNVEPVVTELRVATNTTPPTVDLSAANSSSELASEQSTQAYSVNTEASRRYLMAHYLRPDQDTQFLAVEVVPAVPTEAKPATPAPDLPTETTIDLDDEIEASAPADPETVERVSRYNFDELSRILNDRVGDLNERSADADNDTDASPSELSTPRQMGALDARAQGSLINLSAETLVLNRLPLGIMVFRDQQVLFANRAITEMIGYDSVENLRTAGLSSIFPASEGEQGTGPINHLVRRDGDLVPVTARLQSISWQGRPALMLSASTTEVRTGHEAAVKSFAESFAATRGDGFFETNRAGIISAMDGVASTALKIDKAQTLGRALTVLIHPSDIAGYQQFLERPARFAETARPSITVRTTSDATEMLIFAQGQAGIVSGYFGFVQVRQGARFAPRITSSREPEPAILARVSRGVRGPLNTIIGFADIMGSSDFNPEDKSRFAEYAQDIHTAGTDIAALVDELEDYARLQEGRYLPQRATLDLGDLLASCVVRVRTQANNNRVIVRSAISERLPAIVADRPSLAQAVLNLLASAIDQTPPGGSVVLSAQYDDDGSIAIHVRDSSTNSVELAERFVVFRDGLGRNGEVLAPVRSSVGLALTRSLLAVNACSLSVDPAGKNGLLFSLIIPANLVERV